MDTTKPKFIQELWEACGHNASIAAQRMGCAPSTIQRALKEDRATRKQESKAETALAEMRDKRIAAELAAKAPAQILVSVPPMKLEAFHKVAAAMGLEMVNL